MSISQFTYTKIIRPLLFKIEPEKMHENSIRAGRFFGSNAVTRGIFSLFFNYKNKALNQNVCGINFENPVGLSAGFDKNADIMSIIPSIGFGFGEIGTVTLKSYEGNPKPRLHRLVKSKSIVVNY